MSSRIKRRTPKHVVRRRSSRFPDAALVRLAAAERPEEVHTALLEAAVALGFPRGLIVEADFESGKFGPVAELRWPGARLNAFRGLLSAPAHELAGMLRAVKVARLIRSRLHDQPIYFHPMVFGGKNLCSPSAKSTAVCRFVEPRAGKGSLELQKQVCGVCGIRGYAAALVMELPPANVEKAVKELASLVHAANQQLSRMHWIRHARHRLGEMTELQRAGSELLVRCDQLDAAEQLARRERGLLQRVVDHLGDALTVCDRSGAIVWTEASAGELFGIGRQARLHPAAQPENCAQLAAHVITLMGSPAGRQSENIRLYHPASKKEMEYEARSTKVFDETGQLCCIVTVLRDLSTVRGGQTARLERNMLEIEKFAATGRLAATIAHEVNNPMDAIKNAIYMLSSWMPDSAMPYFNILKSETERVSRIVRQMLGLYRNTEQVRPVNLNTIITDTTLLFARPLQQANIKVRNQMGKLPDTVMAADQIGQVLSNFILNARDAMPEGGQLRIRSRYIPAEGESYGWVRVLVADTGIGIPRELIPSIFDPFITTKGEKGTGLGLWIVKGIIQSHGGRLAVKSRLGQGTVFKIELPVGKP